MRYTCENCGMQLDSVTGQPGRLERCPSCGQVNALPEPPAQSEIGEPVMLSYAEMDTATVEYAGFWVRFVAIFLDGLILAIPNTVVTMIFSMIFFDTLWPGVSSTGGAYSSGASATPAGASLMTNLISMIMGWLYSAFFVSSKLQATPGKRIMGIYVCSSDGARLSFVAATGRFFSKMITNMTCGIGYIMAGFSSEKKALHDNIAGTSVRYGKPDEE